ncbi:ABC transporter permease [Luteolibacter yonseiensis]|uniref:Transport permease protein n=1 Tax=Luteolibacter yonseiensis TaxID=1144680 RepID=A0A934R6M3_9BACT|nr:ABC transporter permease [Luteolibacter yonseiensis]MBK1816390.1 ABC transporter permease [Luteolibacter yonseiensis]
MRAQVSIPKRSPWASQILVIRALINRETATKFGQYKLGFFWMLFEPLVGVVIVGMLIGSIAGRTVPEIPYSYFVLNGMLLLRLFTSPLGGGVKALESSQSLLVYPTVRPLDPIIARFLFHLINTVLAFAVFCLIGLWVGIDISFMDLDTLAICYLLTWLSGCGLGLIFGVGAAHYNEVEKILLVIQRPLLFVSAVMFPISAMPGQAQEWLLWNPLVHTIELSRKALFPLYHAEGANLLYPAIFAIVTTAVGLTLFQLNRNFLTQN